LVALIVMPLVGLVSRSSPVAIWDALVSPAVGQALTLTLITTCIVVLCAILAGTPLAILISTQKTEFRWLRSLIDIPTVLPPAVAGIALLSLFGRTGFLGQTLTAYGVGISFSTAAVVLAQLFVAAPLYIRACMIALDRLDPLLADAARIDGASQWQYWWQVVLPMTRHGLQAGVAMTTARALGEFGATALFAGNMPGRTRTMALAIYVSADSEPVVATAMSIVLLAIALVLLGLTQRGSATVE
jgi:molybdate transport system permease protein